MKFISLKPIGTHAAQMSLWAPLFLLLLTPLSLPAQEPDRILFGFESEEGDAWQIIAEGGRESIAIRWAKRDSLVLELVDLLQDTDTLLSYGYYLRGGGTSNAGLDLNSLHYQNAEYHLEFKDDWSADGDYQQIDLEMTEFSTGEVHYFLADPSTLEGSIMEFRYNELAREVELGR